MSARLRPYRLTVSRYGATAETYDQATRNRGAFERLTRGLVASHDAGLPVRLNVIVAAENALEASDMVRLAEHRWGFPHQLFTNMSSTINGEATPLASQVHMHVKTRRVFTTSTAPPSRRLLQPCRRQHHLRSLIRRAWTTHRWDERPNRRP